MLLLYMLAEFETSHCLMYVVLLTASAYPDRTLAAVRHSIKLVDDLLVLIRITLCRANLEAFPLSPAFKPQPADTFNPISSSLDDMDSVLIPVGKVAVYLDKSLKALGLHTEARTSFIMCVNMRCLLLLNHKHVTKLPW
jgi:hypothetical protein